MKPLVTTQAMQMTLSTGNSAQLPPLTGISKSSISRMRHLVSLEFINPSLPFFWLNFFLIWFFFYIAVFEVWSKPAEWPLLFLLPLAVIIVGLADYCLWTYFKGRQTAALWILEFALSPVVVMFFL